MLLNTIEKELKILTNSDKSPENLGFNFLRIIKSNFGRESQRKVKENVGVYSDVKQGLILKKWLHYAPSSPGQAQQALSLLENSKSTQKYKTRFIMTYDGSIILAKDTKVGDLLTCNLADLSKKAVFFSPLYGQERFSAVQESSVDKQATIQLGKIYDALIAANPKWSQSNTHNLNTFMTRLLFCLFAEDTNIFPKNLLSRTMDERGGISGEHLHVIFKDVFRILNTPKHKREDPPHWLNSFPYVNGYVFDLGDISIPTFSPVAYQHLKTAASINWADVHADVLGSAIQKIVDVNTRADLGMHYTSISNIHKLINPLFVDEFKNKIQRALRMKNPKPILESLLNRLYDAKFFDPACGSGNVLVVTYKSMREIEHSIIQNLSHYEEYTVPEMSNLSLSQFFGIEFADFAAETAKVALRIVEHQMDKLYVDTFNTPQPKLPLRDAPVIHTGSALTVDWVTVCKVHEDDEVFIVGNPPYLGAGERSKVQSAEQNAVFKDFGKPSQKLDYISNWFWLSKQFHQKIPNTRIGIVSTSSINQGVHLSHFWPAMLDSNLRINFAHLPFKWGNLAAKNAQVTCVIIGMSSIKGDCVLFDGEKVTSCSEISPYLNGRKDVTVQPCKTPLNPDMPLASFGCQPNDGGHLFVTESEYEQLDSKGLGHYVRIFYGSKESTQGGHRYTLWLPDTDTASVPADIRKFTDKCRDYRMKSQRAATAKLAAIPHKYAYIPKTFNPDAELNILIPRHSSSKREYLPVTPLFDGEIIGDSAIVISDAKSWHFALLSSRLHCLWLGTVGGRIKTDYRYASTLVWNTFPTPSLSEEQKLMLNLSANKIIQAREEFGSEQLLGDLYNPDTMPKEIKEAHLENDKLVESIFSTTPLRNDDDRLSALFELYTTAKKVH